ncbi:MAG TPA: DUF6247 family protein [Pseudonocardiaceae bacterium]|nr:DUF6247 family protein [Pseudonocardiaceae bacterium]
MIMDVTMRHDDPAAIRDSLIDEERADFERAYEKAMFLATGTMDLTPVLEVLRSFRRIAVITQRQESANVAGC